MVPGVATVMAAVSILVPGAMRMATEVKEMKRVTRINRKPKKKEKGERKERRHCPIILGSHALMSHVHNI